MGPVEIRRPGQLTLNRPSFGGEELDEDQACRHAGQMEEDVAPERLDSFHGLSLLSSAGHGPSLISLKIQIANYIVKSVLKRGRL